MDGKKHFLEDLAVGQTFRSGTYRITAEEITAFAGTFDPQPFHLSDEGAKDSIFGTLAASGWHTAAITMRLNVEAGLPLAGGIIGAGGAIKWPRPTRPGDTLHVVNTILDITPSRSKPDRGMVSARTETFNQDGAVVQELVATLVVPRRPRTMKE
jgi:acyl dehydratase